MPVIDYQTLAPNHAASAIVEYISHASKAAAVRSLNLPEDLKRATGFFEDALGRAHGNAKPLAHIAISWPHSEEPSIDVAFDYGEAFLKRLGLGSQAALLAAHDDATHRHIHILLDRLDRHGKPLLQERIAERIIDIRDELAAEYGFAELGRNAVATSNKLETAKAWNGRFTFTEYLQERLRRAEITSFSDLDDALSKYQCVRIPDKTGFRIEYHGSKAFYSKGSAIGFGPRRTRAWGPQPPATPLPEQLRPADTYDAFLAREESLTPYAKTHPKRLEYEQRRRKGENVGQLGRFLRTSDAENTMNDSFIADLSPEEIQAIEESRKTNQARSTTVDQTQAQAPPPHETVPENTIGAPGEGGTARATGNTIGGPATAAQTNGRAAEPPLTLRSAYRAYLANRGASSGRIDALEAIAQGAVAARREAAKQALGLTSMSVDRHGFVDALRAQGAFARSAHVNLELSNLYSGQAYMGIDAFAHIAAQQLKTTPEALAQGLASRAAVFGIDPSFAATSALADLHVAADEETQTHVYRVDGSDQEFTERADRRFHFESSFNVSDNRTLDAALLAAAAMHGGRVEINGDERFVNAALQRAAILGIEVTNHRDRFTELSQALRKEQSERLTLQPAVRDNDVIARRALSTLGIRSRDLLTERTDNTATIPYRVDAVIPWNGTNWMLLRDSSALPDSARASEYFLGPQPPTADSVKEIKVGDIVSIENQIPASGHPDEGRPEYRINEHYPDPERERRDAERNKRAVDDLLRKDRQPQHHGQAHER